MDQKKANHRHNGPMILPDQSEALGWILVAAECMRGNYLHESHVQSKPRMVETVRSQRLIRLGFLFQQVLKRYDLILPKSSDHMGKTQSAKAWRWEGWLGRDGLQKNNKLLNKPKSSIFGPATS